VSTRDQDAFEELMETTGVPVLVLGEVTDGNIDVDDEDFGHVSEYKEIYMGALEKKIEG
jgi:phosphoribosylformylglycinamidine synthase